MRLDPAALVSEAPQDDTEHWTNRIVTAYNSLASSINSDPITVGSLKEVMNQIISTKRLVLDFMEFIEANNKTKSSFSELPTETELVEIKMKQHVYCLNPVIAAYQALRALDEAEEIRSRLATGGLVVDWATIKYIMANNTDDELKEHLREAVRGGADTI